MKYNSLHLTIKQMVLIAILAVALELPLTLWERRTEFTSDPYVFVTCTGFPFEAVKLKKTIDLELAHSSEDPDQILDQHVQGDNSATGYAPWDPEQGLGREISVIRQTPEYLWIGIILNTILFTIFSITLIKLATWVRDEIEYRRYSI